MALLKRWGRGFPFFKKDAKFNLPKNRLLCPRQNVGGGEGSPIRQGKITIGDQGSTLHQGNITGEEGAASNPRCYLRGGEKRLPLKTLGKVRDRKKKAVSMTQVARMLPRSGRGRHPGRERGCARGKRAPGEKKIGDLLGGQRTAPAHYQEKRKKNRSNYLRPKRREGGRRNGITQKGVAFKKYRRRRGGL